MFRRIIKKKEICLTIVFVLLFVNFASSDARISIKFQSSDRVLILAPHPDDEVLGASGIIQHAVSIEIPVKVVYLTNGDNNELAFFMYKKRPVLSQKELIQMGEIRQKESMLAMRELGLDEKNLIFLGYPDFGTLNIFTQYWGESQPFRSMLTKIKEVPYVNSLSKGSPYVGENILNDLKEVLVQFKPTKIFVSHPADFNTDHQAFYLFLRVALWDLKGKLSAPEIYPYLIHANRFPSPRGLKSELKLQPSESLKDSSVAWYSIDVSGPQVKKKKAAIDQFKTQLTYSRKFLYSFVRRNELFGDFQEIELMTNKRDIDWEAMEKQENILSEVIEEENIVEKTIKTVTYARDNNNLYIKLKSTGVKTPGTYTHFILMPYRETSLFSELPKIRIRLSDDKNAVVYNKRHPVIISDFEVQKNGKEINISFPLTALENPDYVLSSIWTRKGQLPVEATAWRVFRLN